MVTAPAVRKGASIPQFGTIAGGLLDGWSFAFEKVGYSDGILFIDLRVSPPHWPFARTVRFAPRSFRRLVAGHGAKRHEARPLFEEARQLAKTGKQEC